MPTFRVKTDTDMRNFGAKLAKTLHAPRTIELIGDVGAGKTTLAKGIAKGLGITELITSPSFTLNKRYTSQKGPTLLSHYDFYRLSDPGIMTEELAESIADKNTITIIEWADTIAGVLPENRTTIAITLQDDDSRRVVLQ